MPADYSILINKLKLAKESTAMNILEQLVEHIGVKAVLEDSYPIEIEANNGQILNASLLYCSVIKNHPYMVKKLLELGVNANMGTSCQSDKRYDDISPLMVAIQLNRMAIIPLLLDHGADLLCVSNTGLSTLMATNSVKVARLLLDESRKRGTLNYFISLKNQDNLDAWMWHAWEGNLEILQELNQVIDFQSSTSVDTYLTYARYASLHHRENSREFDEICRQLRPYRQTLPVATLESQSTRVISQSEAHHYLFREKPTHKGETQDAYFALAIKHAIAEFYTLLSSPKDCFKYLRHLNKELLRYYQETYPEQTFPTLDTRSYTFQMMENLFYPIPTDNYAGIARKQALQELLIRTFKRYGLAAHHYKWLGFIPASLAEHQMQSGDFVIEARLGAGLYHGRLTHMLQRIFLIYAIDEGRITLDFNYQGNTYQITLSDILVGLTSPIMPQNHIPWNTVLDSRYRTTTFSDPYCTISMIMHECHKMGCPALADYLIDSFCKGFIEFHTAYIKLTPFHTLTKKEFIQHIEDLTLREFANFPGLITEELNQSLQNNQTLLHKGPDHAVIIKNYTPNEAFTSRPFHAPKPVVPSRLGFFQPGNNTWGNTAKNMTLGLLVCGTASHSQHPTTPLGSSPYRTQHEEFNWLTYLVALSASITLLTASIAILCYSIHRSHKQNLQMENTEENIRGPYLK